MKVNGIEICENDFCFRQVAKEVSVSKSGHGVVIYRVSAVRTNPCARYILHKFGPEEGIPPDIIIPDIRIMSRNYIRKGILTVYDNDTFTIRGVSFPAKRAFWKKATLEGNSQCFLLDTKRTFGDQDAFNYSWGWSFKTMFNRIDPKGLFTSYEAFYPVEELITQMCFAMDYRFKKPPELIVINSKCKRLESNRLTKRFEPSGFCTYGVTIDDILCKYFIADIKYPKENRTYKIEWTPNNKRR